MSVEPISSDEIDQMSITNLRIELRKRNIDCTDASRKILIKRLREVFENEDDYAMKCYSGTKCETGCLYWDIEWDAIDCISANGPGNSIKSTNITVGDYDWYAELFPKGELQNNNSHTNILTNDDDDINNNLLIPSAPALFLSIYKTTKPVQMRFTVQLYHPRSHDWSDPVISSLRVFKRNNHGWGWKEWMDYNDLKHDYECNHKLKLKISIDVYGPIKTHIINDKITFNIHSELSNKMNILFNNGTHSDCIIVVSGYTIYENKCKALQQSDHNDSDSDSHSQSKSNSNSHSNSNLNLKRKLNNDMNENDCNMPANKRRKLNCIDSEHHSHTNNTNNISFSPLNVNKHNKSSTIEKLSVLGIDEESKDKNGRTFVSLEIPVHKCILSNFSAYFASMFAHQFKENVDGKIYIGKSSKQLENKDNNNNNNECDNSNDIIDNVDPYVMKCLLEYIYTEKVEKCVDRYLLLLLADRYQIERLVMICLQDLTNEMNINNVTTILSISNKFNEKYSCAKKVKLICLDFICKNISFVMETSSYKNCAKNDKSITQEILTAFANNHRKTRNNNAIIPQKRRTQK